MARRSPIPFPATVTASASGRSRSPPQAPHNDSAMNPLSTRRIHSLSVSLNLRSRIGSTPSNGAVRTQGRRPRQNRIVIASPPDPRNTSSRSRSPRSSNGVSGLISNCFATALRRSR